MDAYGIKLDSTYVNYTVALLRLYPQVTDQ